VSVSLRPSEASSPASIPFNLFVCRGCLGSCSYCAIPRSIGRVHSKDVDDIVAEFRYGLDEGHLLFNILGDDPGCWGQDRGHEFPELLSALLAAAADETSDRAGSETRPVRFRIREIHPKYLTRYGSQITALPGFSAVEGILVPVQSGSDRILDLMQREHTTERLMRTVNRIREAAPGVRLETQMIVGFPSETDDDFAATLDFVRDAGFDSVVVFPYHDKPGTVSSELGDKVAEETIQRRMRAAFKYFRGHKIRAYYSCP